MAIATDKLAPRIIINENDVPNRSRKETRPPVTLIFGFSPIGRICEMVECNTVTDIYNEFGYPQSASEKYFIDAGLRLISEGATVLMTRLPYDNFQSHQVKFVDFKVGEPVAMSDIVSGPMEDMMRSEDDNGVTTLLEMNNIDPLMNQYQRISQVRSSNGIHIGHLSSDELIELELDPRENLDKNTFRIIDIKSQQYGTGAGKNEYTGIFPIIVTAPMALYYQSKIHNTTDLDRCFNMIDVEEGIEMSTKWFRQANPIDDFYKMEQSRIVASITRDMNFNSKDNKFHRAESFEDECVRKFPMINYAALNKLDKAHLADIGILVCGLKWDNDVQETKLVIVESFVGGLGNGVNAIDRKINASSQYIRMFKNLNIPEQTDFFVINDQKILSLGMEANECEKYINYKTSIVDPITYMLEHTYSDVDSLQIDVILDAGISATAFAAYVAKNDAGESFATNPKVRTKIDWYRNDYPIDDNIENYALVWNRITKMFGDFIKNVRGDCVYIADGPRILNLERNYPLRNYTDLENIEIFNKYLPYFQGYTNNYVAKYFNWVYIEDMQRDNRGFWVPGSVVMGSQLAFNDTDGQVWFAPAGQNRGLVKNAFDVSLKTKQYNQENDLLYQNQWNFFNIYQNDGVIVEGQKTLQTKKTSLDRLNTRRMVCWMKQQIRIISNRYKYEPHTTAVRESYRKDIEQMLFEVKKTHGISDYFVICDTSNNTTESIDRHELYCRIGVKPIKALEYIIIDLDIINGKVSMNDNLIAKG